MKKLLLIALFSLVGCSAGIFETPYYGAEKHVLYCADMGEEVCHQQANNLCPNGYVIDEAISSYRGEKVVLWSMRIYCK